MKLAFLTLTAYAVRLKCRVTTDSEQTLLADMAGMAVFYTMTLVYDFVRMDSPLWIQP